MKNKLALVVLASTALLGRPVAAEDKLAAGPGAAGAPDAPRAATLDLYVTLVPYVEYQDLSGPTAASYLAEPGHIGTTTLPYNGVDGAWRFRMLSNTSHFGIRGSLALAEQFRVVGQFETAVAIDGNSNPWEQDFPNRTSYIGVTGDWGTLAFGMMDSPYKWITLTTVNPIKAGYVADYTPIIGTPGFLVTAINPVQSWGGSGVSNVSFYRREANFIQYWSPTVAGFSLRAGITTNEFRPSRDEGGPASNPFIASAGAGFDLGGLRLRYAAEWHKDYFGLGYIVGPLDAPSFPIPRANDWGHKALLQYTLTVNPHLKTRIVGIGEYLKYTLDFELDPMDPEYAQRAPAVIGEVNSYSRPAFYAMLEQTFSEHHVWGAYGRAFPGTCERNPHDGLTPVDAGLPAGSEIQPAGTPVPCSTADIGAQYLMAGYMYAFNENVQAFLAAYRLINERSALYVTSPSVTRDNLGPGADATGVGLGFYYAFGADLLAKR